jgi:phenylalanyl-tRNA synthetase alpha chain
MDEKKLQELKEKASAMLSRVREDKMGDETVSQVREKMSDMLKEIKKMGDEEKRQLGQLTDDIHNGIMEFMEKDLKTLHDEALKRIKESADERELHDARVAFLGKKGRLTAILRGMKDLSSEDRPRMGAMANKVRNEIEEAEGQRRDEISALELAARIEKEKIDITLPARHHRKGHLHPLNRALRTIAQSFIRMGYTVEEGPEIEKDYFNFYCLNLPKDHPARDMQDSFYITPDILLRTHTSPVQARTMQKHEPNSPIRMICPGKVFRWDNDATHSPVFHQVEGLVVDKGITFADLKGTLEIFLKDLFGSDTRIRFRASYFPFTEPSAEVDISFASRVHDDGEDPDWLEILGCGMVHPNVLRLNGYDPDKVSGFAFGMGIERIAMLLYGIDDLRLFYENDMRFLKQF